MTLRYLSVCSGIEAASVAAEPFGWTPVAFSEIDKAASNLLRHRYPHVPNWGDMTRFQEWPDADVDVLVGGTPCQSFSVAGMRQGLDDPRGNLMLTFGAVARRYRPEWLVWENVPGVLSSNGGRDFGAFLWMLGQLGYGVAYRVLDAQYVRTRRFRRAVPQRRRRVWVVGHLGDWRRAAAVLFDRESLSGHPPPRREQGKKPAPTLASRPTGGGGLGTDFDLDGGLIPEVCNALAALAARDAKQPRAEDGVGIIPVAHTLRGEGFDATEDGSGRGTPIVAVAPTLRSGGNATGGDRPPGTDVDTCDSLIPIAIQERATSENPDNGPQGAGIRQDGAAYTLEARHHVQAVAFRTAGGKTSFSVGDVPGALRGEGHGGGHAAIAFDTPQKETRNADAYEADTSSVLSTLRGSVGKKAFRQWGLGVLAAFRQEEVLQSWLHGASLRGQTKKNRPELDDGTLPREESSAGKLLRRVWEDGPDGRTSQGRGLAKQLAGEPAAPLSVLPHEDPQQEANMLLVRDAREGARSLRKALSALQEMGRSAGGEDQPAHSAWKVRRLTPLEAERLMGLPDGYTDVPVGNRRSADGPRYKQIGNSWATNCAEWIFERLTEVDAW